MKDTQISDLTSLKQRFSSQPAYAPRTAGSNDLEPFRKAPEPSVFNSHHILSSFRPDPLLLVTPEKSLAQQWRERSDADQDLADRGRQVGDRYTAKYMPVSKDDDAASRGKPRVRFAPGTRTSPSDKEIAVSRKEDSDEDSMPRSFSAVSHQLYRPSLYADSSDEESTDLKEVGGSDVSRLSTQWRVSSADYFPLVTNSTSSEAAGSQGKVVRRFPEQRSPGETQIIDVVRSQSLADDSSEANFSSPARSGKSSRGSSPSGSPSRGGSRSPVPNSRRSPSRSPSRKSASRSPSPNARPSSRPLVRHVSPGRRGGSRSPPSGGFDLDPDSESEGEPSVQVIREAPLRPKLVDYVFPFDGQDPERRPFDSKAESHLARPEFNSTLKISEELKVAKAKIPDAWGSVCSKLRSSERTRTQIQEKASSKVNVELQSGLYSGLVDVDVPLHALCHSVEKGISLKAPLSTPAPAKVPVGKEPDLMEFFTPDLQPEFPDLTVSGIQPITESLTTADPILAFDLYRHNRAWDGLTDS